MHASVTAAAFRVVHVDSPYSPRAHSDPFAVASSGSGSGSDVEAVGDTTAAAAAAVAAAGGGRQDYYVPVPLSAAGDLSPPAAAAAATAAAVAASAAVGRVPGSAQTACARGFWTWPAARITGMRRKHTNRDGRVLGLYMGVGCLYARSRTNGLQSVRRWLTALIAVGAAA